MDLFIELILVVLGQRDELSRTPSEEDWQRMFQMAEEQTVTSFVFTALGILNKNGQKPPSELLYEWIGLAEQVKAQNVLMNREAARLTALFEKEGHQTAILKGQANARLYSNPMSRLPGDIDIWVEGGRDSVIKMLRKLKMMDDVGDLPAEGKATLTKYYVHLPANEQGVVVEVHFLPSSGNCNPRTNRRMMKWLEREIAQTTTSTLQQFCVPSIKFALVMQLSHIQRHYLGKGIGLRQVCDYYWLLQHSTPDDRNDVAGLLQSFGLSQMAGALMWILHNIFHLDEELMLCKADRDRGEWMLRDIM